MKSAGQDGKHTHIHLLIEHLHTVIPDELRIIHTLTPKLIFTHHYIRTYVRT